LGWVYKKVYIIDIKYFTMIGLRYHHLSHEHVRSDMAELILSYLPQGGVAADLGCGSGRFCQVLLNKAGKVYCVDIDDYVLNIAKESIRDEKAVFLNEDASSTSIPTGSVDLIIMVNSFHDMENKDKVALEVGRILKQSGLALIIESKPGLTVHGPPPWLRMSPDDVIKYFKNTQFEVVGIKDLGEFNAIVIKKL